MAEPIELETKTLGLVLREIAEGDLMDISALLADPGVHESLGAGSAPSSKQQTIEYVAHHANAWREPNRDDFVLAIVLKPESPVAPSPGGTRRDVVGLVELSPENNGCDLEIGFPYPSRILATGDLPRRRQGSPAVRS